MSYQHGVSVGRTQAACRLSVCHEPDAGDVELRDGFVGFGNTAPRGQLLVHGRRERLGPPATFNARTGAGYVSLKLGDYVRAEEMGVRVILMLVETFGGLGPALVEELRKGVAEARGLSVAADPRAAP